MGSSFSATIVALLGMLVISMTLTAPVQASAWIGWDNGEFDICSSCHLGSGDYVGLQESFTQQMSWSSSPPDNFVSMQYNPDEVTSFNSQSSADWFQAAVEITSASCPAFTVQVYSTVTTQKVWEGDGGGSVCSPGFLATGATWVIREDIGNFNNNIADVYFSSTSSSGSSSSYTLLVPQNWKWLRSNLCWCGTTGGSTTFTSAFGKSTAYSDAPLDAIDPPVVPATAESSNMHYSTFINSGTTAMWQLFGVGFSLLADPSTVTITCTYYGCDPSTGTVDSALFITSYGYGGTVSLSYAGTGGPSDPYLTGPSSGSVSQGGQTILDVTSYRGGTRGGTFTWTITGTGGGYTYSTTVTIQYYFCKSCLGPAR